MNEPAAYSWSAVLYELYSRVFPESVHILGILMLYRPICLVCDHKGPGVEFKVCLMSQ